MNTTKTPRAVKGINKCVRVPAGDVFLLGDLQVPGVSSALVLFAYCSGRSRNNPRHRHVAQVMRAKGISTLMCDLMTEEEEIDDEATGRFRNDAEFLAKRLVQVTDWALAQPETKDLRIGYFGACSGGAAVIIAAARMKDKVGAVVSRGGRMDLATKALPRVKCPTLMIVGTEDTVGMELNREALVRLTCTKELVEVAGASHLFGEPGKVEEMAELSAAWFHKHLCGGGKPPDTRCAESYSK
jgi:dienelactone hydrolase